MNSFSDMLQFLRRRENLSQVELAEKLGLAKSTISMYENGARKPSFEVLELLADFFNVNMSTLVPVERGESAPSPSNVLPMPEMREVPLLGVIACGEPLLAAENIEGSVSVPAHVTADFALRCKGDSMINARILDGDLVYIRRQDTVENGQIAAVLIDDEATLKRVFYYPEKQKLVLNPENPQYEPLIFVGEELASVRILGRAVAFTSAVR